jgi:glycosyltransferase involved in cell wall biosynthesis
MSEARHDAAITAAGPRDGLQGRRGIRVSVLSHTYAVAINRQKLDAVAERGFALQVITAQCRREVLRTVTLERRAHDPYVLLGLRAWPDHPNAMAYDPAALLRALIAFRPHILHVEEEPHSVAMAQALLALRAPHLRRTALVYFTWRNIEEHFPPPFCWIERLADRRADRVIAGNDDAALLLIKRGVARERIARMPQLGVDTSVFTAPDGATTPPREHVPIVGYLGRLVAEKGVDTLLHAARQGESAMRLRICGGGPDADRLIALARELGIAERVTFLPGVSHDEAPAFLRSIDVLVLPSRTTRNWKEQFGHVLIEAMASGVPVIGSDSAAIPEVIGDAGMLFPEGDAAALARALREIAPPERRATLRARGLARVRAHYEQAAIADQLATLYRELLAEHAR